MRRLGMRSLRNRGTYAAGLMIAIVAGCLLTGCCANRPASCARNGFGSDCGTPRGGPIVQGLNRLLSCGSSCGDVYWDEWLSDPPEACDPCDAYGNWNGHQACGPRRPLGGFWQALRGCRGNECCDDVDCDQCDGAGCSACGADGADANHTHQPSAAASKQQAVVPISPYFGDAPADSELSPSVPRSRHPDAKADRPTPPHSPRYTRPASYSRSRS
ncbi:MAG: hypothetical protein ACKOBW_10970 [Planctomycetota bacterium]